MVRRSSRRGRKLYVSVFPNSKIDSITRYGKAGHEIHGRLEGSVMTATFELDRQPFVALNGGPIFQFSEAVSFQIYCQSQEVVDYYWDKLGAGGDPKAQQCGWLKDRFGLSRQVVPTELLEMIADADTARSQRATQAMLKMKKLDLELRQAFAG